ncbi:hypothetical protein TNCT_93111 [Trichonephila clavata]|uniref:Uncharacterized protein n=1 Tax=Trichonephila clavata TaxID=2740835 RepID=A0A8X6F1G9_TRICU|nr:hypothetical protein TNCT_93111 [Trichonephila clavata]
MRPSASFTGDAFALEKSSAPSRFFNGRPTGGVVGANFNHLARRVERECVCSIRGKVDRNNEEINLNKTANDALLTKGALVVNK